MDPALARLLSRAESDPDVLAVILFGSHARGEAGPTSDVDVCLVLVPGADPDRAFDDFRHIYRQYLDEVARG